MSLLPKEVFTYQDDIMFDSAMGTATVGKCFLLMNTEDVYRSIYITGQ